MPVLPDADKRRIRGIAQIILIVNRLSMCHSAYSVLVRIQ